MIWDFAGEVPLVLKLNGKTDIPPDHDALSPVHAGVEEAARLGADAVGYTLYVGTPAAQADYAQLRQIRADAHRLGMPLIVWAYPRGSAIAAKGGKDSFYAVDYAARVAISPITFIISLFNGGVSVYEVHNNGNWYDFGFILGIATAFSGPASGARATSVWAARGSSAAGPGSTSTTSSRTPCRPSPGRPGTPRRAVRRRRRRRDRPARGIRGAALVPPATAVPGASTWVSPSAGAGPPPPAAVPSIDGQVKMICPPAARS